MNEHIDKIMEDEFRKQFDELGLKPPKGSMPNLEREMIIDYWRKKLKENWNSAIKACEESLGEEMSNESVGITGIGAPAFNRGYNSHLSQTKERISKLLV